MYRKVPKFSNARKLCCNLPKIEEQRLNLWVFRKKDANGIANIELFSQTYMSENFGSLQYLQEYLTHRQSAEGRYCW